MKLRVRLQLSTGMFLQFFAWGTWYVTLGTYLSTIGFGGTDIGDAYSAAAWAALVSPFFVGLIADRFFAAQRVLGLLHLAASACLFWVSTLTDPTAFFFGLLLMMLCYMPTVALTNAVCFHQMSDAGSEFPTVRVFGTIGWIAAGWLVGMLGIESTALPMKIAACASVLTGVFAFFLPHTPPRAAGQRTRIADVLGLNALALLRDRSFAVFAIGSLLVSIPLAFYYNFANLFLNEIGVQNAAGKMTFGQMSEIVFMLLMPFFFRHLGVKKMLLVAIGAWALRYVLFAEGAEWMLYAGILLHGICFNFFFVTGQIYVDRHAGSSLRASAQGFIALLTYGVGALIGAKASGYMVEQFSTDGGHAWSQIWPIPAAMALVVFILFAFLFNEQKGEKSEQSTPSVGA